MTDKTSHSNEACCLCGGTGLVPLSMLRLDAVANGNKLVPCERCKDGERKEKEVDKDQG